MAEITMPNFLALATGGYEAGRKIAGQNALQGAVQEYGLNSPQARNALSVLDPNAAFSLDANERRSQQQADQFDRSFGLREEQFRWSQDVDRQQIALTKQRMAQAAAEAGSRRRSALEERQREQAAALVGSVLSLPPEQRAQGWAAARAQAGQMGLDVAQIPDQYPGDVAVLPFYSALSGEVWKGGADGGKVGLSPIYGRDAEGNPVILQATDQGRVIQPQLPDGVTLSRDPIRMDVGNGFVLMDPITRQQIGFIPKDVEGEAAAKAAGGVKGKAAAEAEAGAPKALAQADQMLAIIDGVANDPQLGNALGWAGYGVIPDVPGVNTAPRARIDQLKGATFLQAYDALKGGGQITEVEGTKAESAIARLKQTQEESEFRAALKDLRDVVSAARERALRIGGGQAPFEAELDIKGVSDEELMRLIGR